MRFEHVRVEALAYAVPDTVVTTASIEASIAPLYRRLGIAGGFVEGLTGIQARRFWDKGVQPSDAATIAAERALGQVPHLQRERIGVLVNTSVCKDYLEPSVASLVHGNLKLAPHALNFDVGNACLGFMTGMMVVANMIELGQVEVGMVVAGEGSRGVIESTLQQLATPWAKFETLKDNLATLTLGSGAAAMVLCRDRLSQTGHRLVGGAALAATEHNRLCVGTDTYMKTDPARLLTEGVKVAQKTWGRVQAELEFESDTVHEFALHQVGKANHESVLRALGLPEEKALRVYPDFGNVGSAGVPITLARAAELQRVKTGDRVALMGIGSGLNCAMMVVEW